MVEAQPPAKRMKMDESCQDLHIEIEGETLTVHSQFLTFVSPVFRSMLSSGMTESRTKAICLPDKKKEEFVVFMEAIQPLSKLRLTPENAPFLARWADEYGVDVLKEKCEEHLMTESVTVASLKHAVECNLHRYAEKCYNVILQNIHPYVADLVALGSAFPQEMLERLWPAMSEAAGLGKSPVPETQELRALLPVVQSAISSLRNAKELEGKLAAKDRQWSEIKRAIESWPEGLYNALPGTHNADGKGRAWLSYRLSQLGL
mmetsp:Transcript_11252/g.20570  ORF Transcript_11252/g.20570 Transcript_11252/m.20570 type:complete len:261 (-) Transcript_11252:122-904(-)